MNGADQGMPPVEAFRFEAAPLRLESADAKGRRRFGGVAYSGHPIRGHWYWGTVVFDLDTTRVPERVPVLIEHDRHRRAGFARLRVSPDGLVVDQGVLLDNEHGRAVAAESDAGFPWQLSVHIEPARVEEVEPGTTVRVNGRELTGPVVVFRDNLIREVSFTPTGADPHTVAYAMSRTLRFASASGVRLNRAGYDHARRLIRAGKVNTTSRWSISAEDENRILGDPPDWKAYAKWHLGIDPGADDETKARYKYPFGKNGTLYRSALVAIRQRAAQQGHAAVFDAAGRLLDELDERKEEKMDAKIQELEQKVQALTQQLSAAEQRAQQAEQALEAMRKEQRLAAVRELFGALGREISEAEAEPYLAMDDKTFATVAEHLKAARPKAPEHLFKAQATDGRQPEPGQGGEPFDFRAALDKAAEAVSVRR